MVDFKGKKVLVTGGTGFVGGRLIERLFIEEGANVRVLVHKWTSASWVARLPVDLVLGDVTDPNTINRAIEGCEYIFHCASGGNSYDELFATNVEGTQNVLEAARRTRIKRMILVSSVVVHGVDFSGRITEDLPFVITGRGYNDSKIQAEKTALAYYQEYNVPITIIRPTFVWGPRGGQFTVAPVQAMRNGHFALINEGRAECPAVFVDNLVDAMLLSSRKPEAVGEAFLITDGDGKSWKDFFQEYARMLDIKHLKSIDASSFWVRGGAKLIDQLDRFMIILSLNPAPFWRRALRRSFREIRGLLNRLGIPTEWYLNLYSREGGVSIDKARRLLGYAPRIGLREGMRITEMWLRDQLESLMG